MLYFLPPFTCSDPIKKKKNHMLFLMEQPIPGIKTLCSELRQNQTYFLLQFKF